MSLTISVVIPAYNEEKCLSKCLNSLINQTVSPDEIIVVNNNSTDGTAKIVSKYKKVKMLIEKNKGIAYARTTGFNAAKGDIIARIDADTIAAPNWVETILNQFKNDKTIYGLKGRTAISELSPKNCFWLSSMVTMISSQVSDARIGVGPLMAGCNMAIKRDAWKKVTKHVCLDDQEISEDVDLSLLILKIGKIERCSDMLVKTQIIGVILDIPKIIQYIKKDKVTAERHLLKHKNLVLDVALDEEIIKD